MVLCCMGMADLAFGPPVCAQALVVAFLPYQHRLIASTHLSWFSSKHPRLLLIPYPPSTLSSPVVSIISHVLRCPGNFKNTALRTHQPLIDDAESTYLSIIFPPRLSSRCILAFSVTIPLFLAPDLISCNSQESYLCIMYTTHRLSPYSFLPPISFPMYHTIQSLPRFGLLLIILFSRCSGTDLCMYKDQPLLTSSVELFCLVLRLCAFLLPLEIHPPNIYLTIIVFRTFDVDSVSLLYSSFSSCCSCIYSLGCCAMKLDSHW
ncbi:hypothetical protein HGRIS_000759 [Hohenbuehelia grisea]|uniref:Uncharacterized protein n=1 Tax=Hohenbuehelia grisea TaxID=104357 RepID=A0ABR3IPM9_9AGAR